MSARIKDIHIGIVASLLLHICAVLFLMIVVPRSGSLRWEVVPVNLTVFHDGQDYTMEARGVKNGREVTRLKRNAGSPEKKAATPTGVQSSSRTGLEDGDPSYDPKSVPAVTLRPDVIGFDERDEITEKGMKAMSIEGPKGNGTSQSYWTSGAMTNRVGRLNGGNDSGEGASYLAGEPQGGRDFAAIRDAILKNIRYPEGARKRGLEGRVLLSFVVLEDGSTAQIKVVQSSGVGILDEEARRVVAKTKIVRGTPYRSAVLLPVMYSLRQGRAMP